MPSGINGKTGKPNCKLAKCVKAKVKAHKDKKAPTNKLDAIIELLVPKLNDESVSFVGFTSLENTFDMEKDVINMEDITVALLNIDRDLLIKRLEEGNFSSCLTIILYRINPYLPKELRYTDYRAMSSITCRDELKDKLFEFISSVIGYCMRIEDLLSTQYFLNPKATNKLEILKRRYKSNWSENSGKSIEVKHTDEETDKTIEIVIKEV